MIKFHSHMSKIKIFMGVTSNTFKINNYNEMKTIKTETENRNRKFAPGSKFSRGKFLNFDLEKFVLFALLVLLLLQLSANATAGKNSWQYTLSSGVHSFYAPIENLKWANPGLVVSGEINRLLGKKQLFSAGLQLQYGQNNYQGDAASLQLMGQFLPVVFSKMELGIGTGAGYRFSGYNSSPFKWNGSSWENAKMYKGMVQIPLQLSAGYRAINFSPLMVTPFVAYQMQALFGYNPDISPLPDSSLMFGFKFNFK